MVVVRDPALLVEAECAIEPGDVRGRIESEVGDELLAETLPKLVRRRPEHQIEVVELLVELKVVQDSVGGNGLGSGGEPGGEAKSVRLFSTLGGAELDVEPC